MCGGWLWAPTPESSRPPMWGAEESPDSRVIKLGAKPLGQLAYPEAPLVHGCLLIGQIAERQVRGKLDLKAEVGLRAQGDVETCIGPQITRRVHGLDADLGVLQVVQGLPKLVQEEASGFRGRHEGF